MGKTSPNHNTANHALVLAGWEVRHWLGAFKLGEKVYEADLLSRPKTRSRQGVRIPGCVLGTEEAQLQVQDLSHSTWHIARTP